MVGVLVLARQSNPSLYLTTYLPSEKILVDEDIREAFRHQLLQAIPHVLNFLATMDINNNGAITASSTTSTVTSSDAPIALQVGG